jgi:host factor-I protein
MQRQASLLDGWCTKMSQRPQKTSASMAQDVFLDQMIKERCTVLVYLKSGISLHGLIESYDVFVIVLRGPSSEVVYKSAITTIRPSDRTKDQNGYVAPSIQRIERNHRPIVEVKRRRRSSGP